MWRSSWCLHTLMTQRPSTNWRYKRYKEVLAIEPDNPAAAVGPLLCLPALCADDKDPDAVYWRRRANEDYLWPEVTPTSTCRTSIPYFACFR